MPTGIGVIGWGGAATRLHLPVLRRLPGANVVAIAGTAVTPALDRIADRYAIPARYADYRKLLDDPNVEAVVVCVPPDQHEPVGLAALGAGKHVLMEKPLALSLEQGSTLVEAARTATGTAMVGFHLRWHRLVREAQARISSGQLGTLELIRTVFTSGIRWRAGVPNWRTRRSRGGGALIESGIHYFDLWRFLGASEVDEVHATSRSEEIDDATAVVTGRFRNGALATASFCQGTVDRLEIELFGSAGALRVSAYALDGLAFEATGRKGVQKIGPKLRALPRRLGRAARALPLGGYYADAYREQWQGFLDATTSGIPAGASFADGFAATQVALAASQSASLGRPVRVADCADRIEPVRSFRDSVADATGSE